MFHTGASPLTVFGRVTLIVFAVLIVGFGGAKLALDYQASLDDEETTESTETTETSTSTATTTETTNLSSQTYTLQDNGQILTTGNYTFVNSEYGYSIDLPSGWTIAAKGNVDPRTADMVSISGDCGDDYQNEQCGAVFSIDYRNNEAFESKTLTEIAASADGSDGIEITTIAGEPAAKSQSNSQAPSYWVRHDDKLFNISWHTDYLGNWQSDGTNFTRDDDSARANRVATIFEQMLASFKFTS